MSTVIDIRSNRIVARLSLTSMDARFVSRHEHRQSYCASAQRRRIVLARKPRQPVGKTL